TNMMHHEANVVDRGVVAWVKGFKRGTREERMETWMAKIRPRIDVASHGVHEKTIWVWLKAAPVRNDPKSQFVMKKAVQFVRVIIGQVAREEMANISAAAMKLHDWVHIRLEMYKITHGQACAADLIGGEEGLRGPDWGGEWGLGGDLIGRRVGARGGRGPDWGASARQGERSSRRGSQRVPLNKSTEEELAQEAHAAMIKNLPERDLEPEEIFGSEEQELEAYVKTDLKPAENVFTLQHGANAPRRRWCFGDFPRGSGLQRGMPASKPSVTVEAEVPSSDVSPLAAADLREPEVISKQEDGFGNSSLEALASSTQLRSPEGGEALQEGAAELQMESTLMKPDALQPSTESAQLPAEDVQPLPIEETIAAATEVAETNKNRSANPAADTSSVVDGGHPLGTEMREQAEAQIFQIPNESNSSDDRYTSGLPVEASGSQDMNINVTEAPPVLAN
ncbi:hypothetical protein CYMTET_53035, partial [Cymbomonas tetramitiformis]